MIRNASPRTGAADPRLLHRFDASEPGSDETITDLLKQLARQGSHLAEQQLALIKAEMRESTDELKAVAGAMGAAAVVGIAGLGVTLMGVADFVGRAIGNTALGTLIVGLAALGLAYLTYRAGAHKMRDAKLAPDRTEHTLKRTPDAVRGDLPAGERQ